jgi:hypothetical protein
MIVARHEVPGVIVGKASRLTPSPATLGASGTAGLLGKASRLYFFGDNVTEHKEHGCTRTGTTEGAL